MLTRQKEPLNIIISATSDKYVLSKQGFEEYARALNFEPDTFAGNSKENGKQKANLGDGNGYVDQAGLMRQKPAMAEVINGGNHFRYWFQNGSKANTGAIFIAASVEKSLKENHDIVSNGYDMGRDQFVENSTSQTHSLNGRSFRTMKLKFDKSLLKGMSKNDLNHNIGTDGTVVVLEVDVGKDQGNGNNAAFVAAPASVAVTMTCVAVLACLTWI